MPENTTQRRLDQPRLARTRFEVDPDWFAGFSERIARFLGTGRFLAIQTALVVVWIALNLFAVSGVGPDRSSCSTGLPTQAHTRTADLLAKNRRHRDRFARETPPGRADERRTDTRPRARAATAAVGRGVTPTTCAGAEKLADRSGDGHT